MIFILLSLLWCVLWSRMWSILVTVPCVFYCCWMDHSKMFNLITLFAIAVRGICYFLPACSSNYWEMLKTQSVLVDLTVSPFSSFNFLFMYWYYMLLGVYGKSIFSEVHRFLETATFSNIRAGLHIIFPSMPFCYNIDGGKNWFCYLSFHLK